MESFCSLPYRQLRSAEPHQYGENDRSLPYRQLRRHQMDGWSDRISSLPYRQLRRIFDGSEIAFASSLPYRQLRRLYQNNKRFVMIAASISAAECFTYHICIQIIMKQLKSERYVFK